MIDSVSEVTPGSVYIEKVTSDESENGNGDGNTLNDIVITSYNSVDLRAERAGNGNGRVYNIYLAVKDLAGNTGTAVYKVTVPHSKKDEAIDDGAVYEVVSEFEAPAPIPQSLTKAIAKDAAENAALPTDFNLSQNYPNPFNPATTIKYSLPNDSYVRISIFNILGQEVATLVNTTKSAGFHSVTFNANNLASGIYIYRMQAGDFVQTKKLMLMK